MARTETAPPGSAEEKARREYKIWNVIGASSAGTVIEWYDFYIFGTLATTLAPRFYPPGNETVQLLLYLSTFAVGFVVRPFGAVFFGRIGDLVGRKYAFLVTLVIMGVTTAGVGLLPSYGTIGYVAPAGGMEPAGSALRNAWRRPGRTSVRQPGVSSPPWRR